MPVVMESGQFYRKELMGESTLLMQAEFYPEPKEDIALLGEKCWLLYGQLDISGHICMASNFLFIQITTPSVGFTILRSRKGRLLAGWRYFPSLTIRWSIALGCSMVMQIHSREENAGSVASL